MKRLEEMLGRAYTLAAQVLNEDEPDIGLAEEVSGECAELLSLLEGNLSAFDEPELIDPELIKVAKSLQALSLLDRATTILYNLEGDEYQTAYERLEKTITDLKESIR